MPLREIPNNGLDGVSPGLKGPNGQAATKIHLSTNIWIFANTGKGNPIPVGAVTKISYTENKPTSQIYEIGTDGTIDSAPTKSADYNGTVTRTRWNGKRIFEAFGRGFIHMKSMRVPFDIIIYDRMRGADQILVTTLENVWFQSLAVDYSADNWIITETSPFKFEDIHTSLMGDGKTTGIFDANSVYLNPFEVQADVGQYRGAMDETGLLLAYNGSTSNY